MRKQASAERPGGDPVVAGQEHQTRGTSRSPSWCPSGTGVVSSERIQPAWLHQNPLRGVCGSLGGVGVAVVDAVVPRPPQGTLLHRVPPPKARTSWNARLVLYGAVREVAVVAGGDEEHPAPERDRDRIHTAVAGTPVKIASSGSRWITKNGMDDRGLMRPWGRSVMAAAAYRRQVRVPEPAPSSSSEITQARDSARATSSQHRSCTTGPGGRRSCTTVTPSSRSTCAATSAAATMPGSARPSSSTPAAALAEHGGEAVGVEQGRPPAALGLAVLDGHDAVAQVPHAHAVDRQVRDLEHPPQTHRGGLALQGGTHEVAQRAGREIRMVAAVPGHDDRRARRRPDGQRHRAAAGG